MLRGSSHRIGRAVVIYQNVEDDLTGTGTTVLPTLIARLLVIMTHDRKITYAVLFLSSPARPRRALLTYCPGVHGRVFSYRNENFEAYFRRQFTRRVPYKPNPLGTEDELVHWPDVEMTDKLDMLFHLCEWQFAGAGRLRTMMGEVDELEWVCDLAVSALLIVWWNALLTSL